MFSVFLEAKLDFWEGNSGTESRVCSMNFDQSESFHNTWGKNTIGDKGCENDEIRSMTICYARKGFAIRVFDDGSLGTNDDHAMVFAKTNMQGCVTIRHFETDETFTNEYHDEVELTYRTDGNLNGKISSMEIYFEGMLLRNMKVEQPFMHM